MFVSWWSLRKDNDNERMKLKRERKKMLWLKNEFKRARKYTNGRDHLALAMVANIRCHLVNWLIVCCCVLCLVSCVTVVFHFFFFYVMFLFVFLFVCLFVYICFGYGYKLFVIFLNLSLIRSISDKMLFQPALSIGISCYSFLLYFLQRKTQNCTSMWIRFYVFQWKYVINITIIYVNNLYHMHLYLSSALIVFQFNF